MENQIQHFKKVGSEPNCDMNGLGLEQSSTVASGCFVSACSACYIEGLLAGMTQDHQTYNCRYSLVVTHPTTNRGRDAQFSSIYGRMYCSAWDRPIQSEVEIEELEVRGDKS
jgi:hypothetical protein